MNEYGARRVPFLFLVDFEMESPRIFRLDEIPANVFYNVRGVTNAGKSSPEGEPVVLGKYPITFEAYFRKFDLVSRRLAQGDSYLTNLTVRTPVSTDVSLRDIFDRSRARYKLLFGDSFLVFSPETFVCIADGRIWSYPMKGTIDAAMVNAREAILSDNKEMAEHITIVDLIRNDLSTVAEDVQVTRFRYIDALHTSDKDLLQVSSEICGILPPDHLQRLGDTLISLLPAGSVSGAPKRKTIEIIRAAEGEPRGYYTGVFGLFDGVRLDSAVMIRFIESREGCLYYRSGGGITAKSDPRKEYQEIIDKVYVPID